jgi:hypothetical protein
MARPASTTISRIARASRAGETSRGRESAKIARQATITKAIGSRRATPIRAIVRAADFMMAPPAACPITEFHEPPASPSLTAQKTRAGVAVQHDIGSSASTSDGEGLRRRRPRRVNRLDADHLLEVGRSDVDHVGSNSARSAVEDCAGDVELR